MHHLTWIEIVLFLQLLLNLNTDSPAKPVFGHGTLVQAVRGQLGLEAQSLGCSQGARDYHNLIIWFDIWCQSWPAVYAQNSVWKISQSKSPQQSECIYIPAGAAPSSAFDPMDGYPIEWLAGHVRVTSRFTQVLSLTWFKSNRYHSHPKIVVPCKLLQDNSKFSFVEVFAGQAEITRMFRYANLPATRLDLEYMQPEPGRQNPMDLLSDAGMGNLGIIWIRIYVWTWFIISELPSNKTP